MWCPNCHYGSESCKLGTICPQCSIKLGGGTDGRYPIHKNPIVQEAKRGSFKKLTSDAVNRDDWKAPERSKPSTVI